MHITGLAAVALCWGDLLQPLDNLLHCVLQTGGLFNGADIRLVKAASTHNPTPIHPHHPPPPPPGLPCGPRAKVLVHVVAEPGACMVQRGCLRGQRLLHTGRTCSWQAAAVDSSFSMQELCCSSSGHAAVNQSALRWDRATSLPYHPACMPPVQQRAQLPVPAAALSSC